MIRLNYFLRRLPNLSLDAFHEYWREEHAVILTKHASALRVRRYVQAHTLPDDPLGVRANHPSPHARRKEHVLIAAPIVR